MSILEILNAVGATSSKLEKIAILTASKDEPLLKDVFFLTYDKQTNFYTTKVPDAVYWGTADVFISLAEALSSLTRLSKREITGNAAELWLAEQFTKLNPSDASVFARVILRDLRIGATAGTANKVWEGLIPKPDFMLAETDPKKIVYPAISQNKEDGARSKFQYAGPVNGVTLVSRNGNEIIVHGVFDAWANENLFAGDDLDGELIAVDKDGKRLPRKIGNGIVNKAIKGTISLEEAQSLRFVVWDIETRPEMPYEDRLAWLTERVTENTTVILIEGEEVKSYEEAVAHFKSRRKLGLEGTILKNKHAFWQPRRSFDIVKFKAEVEIDMKVVGVEEGKGKNKGRLGALVVASQDDRITCSVGIFKDFPDSIRDEWFTDPPPFVTVLYNERISKKGSPTESLFLPRVTAGRWDKTEGDTYERILEIERSTLE
ncbi:putative ATP-dependent DNA ligase [Stenotrophomonas phage vB_SmaM_Bhz51]